MNELDRALELSDMETPAPLGRKAESSSEEVRPMRFHSGDILIVTPQSEADPIAKEHAGQRCRFVRYSATSFGSEAAWVQFSTRGKPVPFWPKDLSVAPASASTSEE